jgi:hypothetical protein
MLENVASLKLKTRDNQVVDVPSRCLSAEPMIRPFHTVPDTL